MDWQGICHGCRAVENTHRDRPALDPVKVTAASLPPSAWDGMSAVPLRRIAKHNAQLIGVKMRFIPRSGSELLTTSSEAPLLGLSLSMHSTCGVNR